MTRPVDISEIAAMLAGRIEALAAELLPAGHRAGAEWVEARRGEGGLGDSLTVHLAGAKAGVWMHAAAARNGDALDLVAYLLYRDDKGKAVQWARAWLGLDEADPAEIERRRVTARKDAETRERRSRDADAKRSDAAFALWLSAEPKLKGTPADLYLKARGIDLGILGRQPAALRFHPACREPETGLSLPALVAKIDGPNGRALAVHRTWLAQRADGVWRKADAVHGIKNAKKCWGPVKGGAIRLWRGEVVDPKTGEVKRAHALNQAPPGSAVTLCEGIENALSIALVEPERRVLAAISIDNMANLAGTLPRAISDITIGADNDGPGHAATVSLERAVTAFLKSGRRVEVCRPPAGIKDFNDLLNQKREVG